MIRPRQKAVRLGEKYAVLQSSSTEIFQQYTDRKTMWVSE